MHLLLIGVSHRTAPVELREQLDFQASGLDLALRALGDRPAVREAVVVSTCNRVEIYAACDHVERAAGDLVSFVCELQGLSRTTLLPHLYQLTDLDAARHLFRVAGGLDSLVTGEPQILGQVKAAHTAANGARVVGPLLNRLFHFAFAVGKRVRTRQPCAPAASSWPTESGVWAFRVLIPHSMALHEPFMDEHTASRWLAAMIRTKPGHCAQCALCERPCLQGGKHGGQRRKGAPREKQKAAAAAPVAPKQLDHRFFV